MAQPSSSPVTMTMRLEQRRAVFNKDARAASRRGSSNRKVIGVACLACLGGFVYGYNQAIFSGILTMTSFKHLMGTWVSDPNRKGWMTAIFELGAWFGCLYAGFLAETISRKRAILCNVCVFIVGVLVQCCSLVAGPSTMLAGRFISGMAIGTISVNVPNYNAEVAPPEVRGSLVALQQLSITCGIMVSYWVDYGTNYIGGTGKHQSDAAWLLPICLQLIPGLALVVGLLLIPFSPRWLIHHGREDEARKVLSTLRELPADHELVELEFLEIKAQSTFEKSVTADKWPHLAELTAWNIFKLQFVAIGSLFRTKPMFRRVAIATVTMFFQQFSGINAVIYYAPSIFASFGQSKNTISLLVTGVNGVVMFLATIPTVIYVDKVGRKPILLAGAAGMGICHLTIAVIYARCHTDWEAHRAAGWFAVVLVWLFTVNFGYSWGPCAWVLISEVWPLSNRAYGIALAGQSKWMSNFVVGQITPTMLQHITYGTFIFYGVLGCFGGVVFVWFFVPETKRVTLEEMDMVFGSRGLAASDKSRMENIRREIGLEDLLARLDQVPVSGGKDPLTESDTNDSEGPVRTGKEGHVEGIHEVPIMGI